MAVTSESEQAGAPSISVVVVQPTPFCNINCSYCYLPDRANRSVMAHDTLATLFQKVFASGWASGELTVIWHAGEPLVLPVSYYEQSFAVIESLRPPQQRVHHSFQTNGMLLSAAWCELFRQWQVGVGVSIDGPRRINDAHRRGRSGHSTFDKTLAGIHLLQAEQIPFHVISVLTDESLAAPDAMIEFYRSEGIESVCFNIEESEGAHRSMLLSGEAAQQRFSRFLGDFWREARRDGRVRFVREIDAILPRVFRPDQTEVTNIQVEPFAMLNVDWAGNVSSFSPELLGLKNRDYNDFLIGNILTDSLEQMRSSGTLQAMTRDIAAGVRRCRASCEYFSVCGGGAPVNKLAENGSFDSARTAYCALTQMVPTDLVLQAFEELRRTAEAESLPQLIEEFCARAQAVGAEMAI
jgi:uncharacterized protein